MKTRKTTSRGSLSRSHFTSLITIAAAWCAVILIHSAAHAQNIYVADNGSGNIYEFTPGGTQSTFATGLNQPAALTFDKAGNLYASEAPGNGTGNIYEFTPAGVRTTYASHTNANIYVPFTVGLAFDSTGDLFVGEGGSSPGIYEFTTNGTQSYFYDPGTGPYGIAFDSAGDMFATIDANGSIYEFTNGVASNVGTFAYGLSSPLGLAFDSAGNLYETDQSGGHIYKFTTNGTQSTFASGLSGAAGLAFDSAGNLYVTTSGEGKIYEFTNGVATEKGIFASGLNQPLGIAIAPNSFNVSIKMFAGIILNNGQIGSNYLIQASGNLTNWTTLTNVALPTQPYIYIDYNSPTNPQQFYRATPQ